MISSDDNKSKVTLLCPFYKRADEVERTVKSIASQTYRNFIAILWDDHSGDETWATLKKSVKNLNDDRFIVFCNEENIGMTVGFNKALSMVKTEYVAIVGSGDICLPERLEKQLGVMESDKAAVFCATNSVSIDPETGDKFIDASFSKNKISFDDLGSVVPFTHGTVMYRTDAIKGNEGYEETFKWCSDWDLFFRLLRGNHAIYIDQVLYERYALADGVSFHPEKSFLQIQYKYLALILSKVTDDGTRDEILAKAKDDLSLAVNNKKNNIAHDLWKRAVKLVFMGRQESAKRLECIIEYEYGLSLGKKILIFIAGLLTYTPFSTTALVNGARKIDKLRKG